MRRVKNVDYDDDDRWDGQDWDDGSWGGGGWDWSEGGWSGSSAAPAKKAAAKPKAAGKAAPAAAKPAAAKPKAKAAGSATSAAAPAAAPSAAAAAKAKAAPAAGSGKAVVEELVAALGPDVTAERVERVLGTSSSSRCPPEDAFLVLLGEEIDAGRWQTAGSKAGAPAKAPKEEPPLAEAADPPPKGAAKAKAKAAAKFAPEARAKEASAPAPAPPEAEAAEDEEPPAEAPPAVDDERPSISLVVVGHVDAGKSTLMGHLLCLVGSVSSKQLHKFEKDSKAIGKASFAYAWVLDEGEDERQRGVTIDVCVKHFETKSRRFTILDAPGHRDFVPNMLQGAVQADAALLVADASHFEAGFDRGGQTKEHLQLIRSLGISQVIVAVNKLDTCDWSHEVYENLKTRLHAFVVGPDCGFKDNQVSYLPLSGFSGENMLERKEPLLSWWKGPTLMEALDQMTPPVRPPATDPLRIVVSDFYKSGASTCISGKVEAGAVSVGQQVVLLPSGEKTQVKSLQMRGAPARAGRAGDYMDGVVLPVEPQFTCVGGTVCDPRKPVPVVDTLQAQILVFDVEIPMMRGQQFMCYLHTETLTATISKLEKLLVKGKPQERRPKCLQKGNVAIVQLQVSRKVCVEPKVAGSTATSLCRLVLRDRGQTVAAGIVTATL